jgi:hypothetical protein
LVKTDADGRFQTPRELLVYVRYKAVVSPDGFEPADTGWIQGKDGRFPDIVVEPGKPAR